MGVISKPLVKQSLWREAENTRHKWLQMMPFSSGGFSPLVNKHKSSSSWKCQTAAFILSIMASCWHFDKKGAFLGGEWKWNRCRIRGVHFHPRNRPSHNVPAPLGRCRWSPYVLAPPKPERTATRSTRFTTTAVCFNCYPLMFVVCLMKHLQQQQLILGANKL